MPPAAFEPAIPVCERPQTHALEREATGVDPCDSYNCQSLNHFADVINSILVTY